MYRVYIDESIREEAGYIVCALVFCKETVIQNVSELLNEAGLIPKVDEFKSSLLMAGQPHLQALRSQLSRVISRDCKLGFVVADLGERSMLGDICLHGLVKVIGANSLIGRIESVYFDEGIKSPRNGELAALKAAPALSGVNLGFNNDSRQVIGIQLADLAANYISAQIQQSLGMPQKKINVGAEGGYDPPIDVEIGWALGIAIRWSFFCKPCEDANSEDPQPEVNVMAAGGYISGGLREPVAAVVRQTYEHHWLGCIH